MNGIVLTLLSGLKGVTVGLDTDYCSDLVLLQHGTWIECGFIINMLLIVRFTMGWCCLLPSIVACILPASLTSSSSVV